MAQHTARLVKQSLIAGHADANWCPYNCQIHGQLYALWTTLQLPQVMGPLPRQEPVQAALILAHLSRCLNHDSGAAQHVVLIELYIPPPPRQYAESNTAQTTAGVHGHVCMRSGRGSRHGDKRRADGAALGVDADAAGGDRDEGGCNIQPLGLDVDADGEDGDEHLRIRGHEHDQACA